MQRRADLGDDRLPVREDLDCSHQTQELWEEKLDSHFLDGVVFQDEAPPPSVVPECLRQLVLTYLSAFFLEPVATTVHLAPCAPPPFATLQKKDRKP